MRRWSYLRSEGQTVIAGLLIVRALAPGGWRSMRMACMLCIGTCMAAELHLGSQASTSNFCERSGLAIKHRSMAEATSSAEKCTCCSMVKGETELVSALWPHLACAEGKGAAVA